MSEGKIEPNPRACWTCGWLDGSTCTAPIPKIMNCLAYKNPGNDRCVDWGTNSASDFMAEECQAWKPGKGHPARICLNCGKPIGSHQKFTELGDKQWIHKYCEHPEWPSRWHYEKYGGR